MEFTVSDLQSSTVTNVERQPEIADLTGKLCAINTRLNATVMSPIGRLPPELLIQIFHAHRRLYEMPMEEEYGFIEDQYRQRDYASFHPRLFVTSHTCSTWRTVASRCSSLWTMISLQWPIPLMNWVAERNKCGPLTVIGLLSRSQRQALPELLLRRASNIRAVHAFRWPKEATRDIGNLLLAIAHSDKSTLESLSIQCVNEAKELSPLTELLPSVLSTLRYLRLSDININDLPLPPISALCSLELSRSTLWNGKTVNDIPATINTLYPNLRELVITFPQNFPALQHDSAEPVHLSHLEQMHLNLSCSQMTAMLAAVSVPAGCYLNLHLDSFQPDAVEEFRGFIFGLRAFCATLDWNCPRGERPFDSSSSVTLRSAFLHTNSGFAEVVMSEALNVVLTEDPNGSIVPILSPTRRSWPALRIHFEFRPGGPIAPEEALMELLSPLPMTALETLCMSVLSNWRVHTLMEQLLLKCANLRALSINEMSWSMPVCTIWKKPTGTALANRIVRLLIPNEGETVPCAKLNSLVICGLKSLNDFDEEDFDKTVTSCLEKRRERGVPLGRCELQKYRRIIYGTPHGCKVRFSSS